jgi:RHH-type proline utilization regulon transcriptional repressor/proline dehydrogenase/delta 1-pyrroline-5-carboxylate dehydrogenase
MRGVVRRLGLPTVRSATRQAMRVMGSHFVLGQTIEEALSRANSRGGKLFRYSFDMLGEGARTADDARAITRPATRAPSRPSGAPPATSRFPTGRAYRSNSRRCTRATRRSAALG